MKYDGGGGWRRFFVCLLVGCWERGSFRDCGVKLGLGWGKLDRCF